MRQLSRKEFLGWLSASAAGLAAPAKAANSLEQRAAQLIQDYDQQGIHRTGTKTDQQSAHWLAAQAKRCGGKVALESFAHNRVDPQACFVEAGGKRISGLPIFDASFTDAKGIRGRLGKFGSDAEIGWLELPPEASANYESTRRNNRHQALIVLTKGARPGLCPINASEFLHPYGAPILQLSSEHGDWLQHQSDTNLAKTNLAETNLAEVHFVAHAKRTKTSAWNVTATINGTNAKLAPLVVMTPRSGWWQCASERGGGLVCWLEVMRTVSAARPARNVIFVASSGHELGHLGLEAFMERRPGLVKSAHAWMHFGANIGAAQEPATRLQASDDELAQLGVAAMTGAGLTINEQTPRGSVPLGEAGNVHRGGGSYISLLGRNALFHNPADRWPTAVDVAAIARYASAFSQVALKLTRQQ